MPASPRDVVARRRVIGDRIRVARLHANLSQERLGEAAGIDRRTVSMVETGATSPRLDWLLLMADALGMPLSRLVRDEEE
ncbi:helix-turn-helix transcriptional regulator [Streptomyces bohaiensis]|uniref:helix-turn-helix transcriptional regulator n=1 Tax=Streptomyces bohaiensis TaxID=1431344 RepID=UPI003B792881